MAPGLILRPRRRRNWRVDCLRGRRRENDCAGRPRSPQSAPSSFLRPAREGVMGPVPRDGETVGPTFLLQNGGLYSSVVERQSCKLKVLGSIPSGGCSFRASFCPRERVQFSVKKKPSQSPPQSPHPGGPPWPQSSGTASAVAPSHAPRSC